MRIQEWHSTTDCFYNIGMTKAQYQVVILFKHGLYEPYIELAQQGQDRSFLQGPRDPQIKVIHFYGVPGGRVIQSIDQKHEFLRSKNRITNLIQQALDWTISLPFMFWVPRVEKSNKLKLSDDEFQCKVIDTLQTLRWKQLAIYRYVIANFNFDYIYETNASSYVDFVNLMSQVKEFNSSPLYAGNMPTNKFVSGANRFYDRNALQIMLRNRFWWSPSILEDVAIGKLMKRFAVPFVATNSISISSVEELEKISDEVLLHNYHFRVKSYLMGRRSDAQIMHALKLRFSKIRKRA